MQWKDAMFLSLYKVGISNDLKFVYCNRPLFSMYVRPQRCMYAAWRLAEELVSGTGFVCGLAVFAQFFSN
jgi:hypothetical protein